MRIPKYDTINYWSEVKLDIVREYAKAYSTILTAQARPRLHHVYIDAFSGAGMHLSKASGSFVLGSPMNALLVEPPFRHYHFIDLDSVKVGTLRELAGSNPNVSIYEGDCNQVLLEKVYPQVKYEDYRRALCLLDPYGLHLNWDAMYTAGQMRSVEIFVNFPVADMNRNVLWRNSDNVDPAQRARLDAFWGDDSWRSVAYDTTRNLFGYEEKSSTANEDMAKAFRERLRKVADFHYVPEPVRCATP